MEKKKKYTPTNPNIKQVRRTSVPIPNLTPHVENLKNLKKDEGDKFSQNPLVKNANSCRVWVYRSVVHL